MRNPTEFRRPVPETPHEDRSLISLVTDLTRDTATLLREEVELARTELSERVSQATSGIAALVSAAVIMLSGLVVLLTGGSLGLNLLLPAALTPWLGFLIVGAFFVCIGLIMTAKGRSNLKSENLVPKRTVTNIRRDQRMAKEHLR